MEYLDIVDEQGQPTGEIVSRTLAHTCLLYTSPSPRD